MSLTGYLTEHLPLPRAKRLPADVVEIDDNLPPAVEILDIGEERAIIDAVHIYGRAVLRRRFSNISQEEVDRRFSWIIQDLRNHGPQSGHDVFRSYSIEGPAIRALGMLAAGPAPEIPIYGIDQVVAREMLQRSEFSTAA